MRILLVGINYAPDLIGVAKYNTELCESLSEHGHDVRVITAPPYYPAWKIPADFRSNYFTRREIDRVGVTRTPIFVPVRPSGLKRLVHHTSFAITSFFPLIATALAWRPHIILSVAPSLMSAAFVAVVARCTGARSWLHVQDFEVDAAFGLGMLKGDLLRKLMLKSERLILRSFDLVSSISPQMVGRLSGKGVEADRVVEVRNWIDTALIVPGSRQTKYRKELDLNDQHVVAMYSGTMSNKQGLDLIIKAAIQLQDRHPNIQFILAGDGPQKAALVEMAAGVPSVHFLGLQSNENFNELLATADFHLIPQKAEAADLVLPSKLGAIFASSRPVIAMADASTGLAVEVRGAGIVIPPGDVDALVASLVKLSQHPDERQMLGNEGRRRAIEQWDRRTIVARWIGEMETLCGQSSQRPAHQV